MKTKIFVTDACIFIDLLNLELIPSFFRLDVEIHTTIAVYFELYEEQQQILKAYQSRNMLTIHNLREDDFNQIYSEPYPKSLSETDKSVLHVANKLNGCVLSSDKTVRNYAKNKNIDYHGIIWIFDRLIDAKVLSKRDASCKLITLVATNFTFQNNKILLVEVQKRLKLWS